MYLSNVGALGAERIRRFSAKNKVDNNVVVLGASEFLVERSLFTAYNRGFRGLEVSMNEIIAKNPSLGHYRDASVWEAAFGHSWQPLTVQDDEDIKSDLRHAFQKPAEPRSVDGEFRAPTVNGGTS